MADDAISGFVGLVLVPDEATMATARRLAAAVVPTGAESVLAGAAIPHLTLAQCALRGASRARIAGLIRRLEAGLRDPGLPLDALIVFGGGFVFWCVDAESPARAALQAAHEEALTLADGGLDEEANAAVVAATARLTAGDPVLVGHARRYGYAFARERYLPHVTLGFDSRLAAGGALTEHAHPHTMRVARVALARLGGYGVAGSLISLGDV
jgi:hypothetical protein